MDRLKLLDAGLRAFDTRMPDVTPSLCVATRYRSSSCRACLDVCPVGALVTSPWLELDADKCSSCGACAAVCRTGALDFDLQQPGLSRRVPSPRRAANRLCSRSAAVRRIRARWWRRLRPAVSGWAIGGRSAGGGGRRGRAHRLVSGECATCADSVAKAALELAVSTAGETMVALRRCLDITRGCRPGQGSAAAAAPTVSRRGLFRYLARGLGQAASGGTAPTDPERSIGTLHRHVAPPATHRRLILDLSELQARGDDSAVTLPNSLPLAGVVATSACDACGLCVSYCPHGALAIEVGSVKADVHRCSGCGLCVEVCPRSALQIRPAVLSPDGPPESDAMVGATAGQATAEPRLK